MKRLRPARRLGGSSVALLGRIGITRNLRAGATLRQQDGLSETIAGFRIRVDFDARELGKL